MKRELIDALYAGDRNAALKEWAQYQTDIRKPRYVESTIRSLPKPIKAKMANHVLRGIKYTCSDITQVGNRWWTVKDEAGRHMQGCGGRMLITVIPRVQHELERRDGLLAKTDAPAQTQLGKQLGPKAGLVRRAR